MPGGGLEFNCEKPKDGNMEDLGDIAISVTR